MATLKAEPRAQTSSAATNRLRTSGQLPMALIRKSNETVLIQAEREVVKEILSGQHGLLQAHIDLSGETMRVVVKDTQRDPVSRRVLHMTVQEVLDTDIIKVPVPVRVEGEPLAVTKKMATLMVPMSTVLLQAQVSSLPDAIVVDVSKLGQNDKVAASDIKLPEGVAFLCSPDTILATTKQLRGMADFDEAPAAEAEAVAEEAGEAEATTDEPAADAE
ncbi:MAG: 50S ribosomal protein L25 [Armatimonadetes bacterium]|nr:50S ribosomal protein L25 [Armatimonadota bacterium]